MVLEADLLGAEFESSVSEPDETDSSEILNMILGGPPIVWLIAMSHRSHSIY